MKIKAILLIMLCSYFYKVSAQKNESVAEKATIKINIDRLSAYGYGSIKKNPPHGVDKTSLQPISNVTDASAFLDSVYREFKDSINNVNPQIKQWLDKYYDAKTSTKDNVVVVFIQHPVDLNKLQGDKAKRKSIATQYHSICTELNNDTIILTKLKVLKKKFGDVNGQNIQTYSDLLNLIKTESNTIDDLTKQLNALQKSFNDYNIDFAEKEPINEFFLNWQNNDWSNYDLEKKDILVVVLGGASDLMQYKIKIVNGQTYLQTGLSELKSLAGSLGVLGAKDFNADCNVSSNNPTTMPLTFMILNQSEIKAPSTIKFNDPKDSTRYSFKIHEKSYWGIKVGLSFSQLNRQNFSLNSQNQVTVKLDSAQQNQIKTNLAAMIEFYPFGKDYDRLQPIWAAKQQTNFGDRIGIVAGIKIAKDPLQDIYAGASLALSQDYSISFGAQFHSQPKSQTNLPVGINTTLDYLKDNLSREYKTIFFVNLSMAPSAVSKLLGFKK